MIAMPAVINTTSGDTTIIAAQENHQIVVVGFFIVVGGVTNVWFEDGLNGTVICGQMNHDANGGINTFHLDQQAIKEGEYIMKTSVNTALNLAQSATERVGGIIRYYLSKVN